MTVLTRVSFWFEKNREQQQLLVVALGTRGAYLIEKVAPTTLKYLDLVTGATKVLGVLPGPVFQDRGLAVSPDEHWLLYGKDEFAGSQLMLVEGFR